MCIFDLNGGSNNFCSAPGNPISIGNWIHVLYSFDGNNVKTYLNSTLIQAINSNITIFSNIYDLKFGRRHTTGLPYFFNGKLDDIGIWNRALTQQEITDLYNGGICYQNITVTDTLLINMGITGFNPITYSNTIRIFPNPASTHITINYGNFALMSGYQLRITNSLGQQMFQSNINQQSDYLDLSSWTGNGIYFVHIIDPAGNTVDIKKIVLQ